QLLHVDEKANGIEKLKQSIANFVNYQPEIPGGCPILNTAVDCDDGNTILRARVNEALRMWIKRLEAMVRQAKRQGQARPEVDPKTVATLIIASLEGALMVSRLEGNNRALRCVQKHLNRHLDREVAACVVSCDA